MGTQRYKMTLAYRGTRYHGWQAQEVNETWKGEKPPEGQGIPTVQETAARAIAEVVGHPVALVGSSRTDAGVHAKGQVAHFDTASVQIPPEGLRRGMNARLPDDIVVRSVEPVAETFDAISSTLSKRYQYLVWNAEDRPAFFPELAWYRWQGLDVDAMREAAGLFVGERDFASFAKPGHGRENTVRRVISCDVSRRGTMLVIGVEGAGFLWNMVRIMVGTLVEVGLGRYPPARVAEMIEVKDRRAAGPTAPAQGLYLQWVRFAESRDVACTPLRATPEARGEVSVRVLHSGYWKQVIALDGSEGIDRDLRFQNGFVATAGGRVVAFVTFVVVDGVARITRLCVAGGEWEETRARLLDRVEGAVKPFGLRVELPR